MSHPSPPDQGNRRWTAGSIALFVIGLLILVPSGLCSGLMVVGSLYGFFGSSVIGPARAVQNFIGMLYLILIFGGVPMAIGGALVYAGLKARRRG